MKIKEHIEIECLVEFYFEQGEPMTRWHPGCPDGCVDIKITPIKADIERLESSDEIHELCIAEVLQDRLERAYDRAEMLIRGRQEWNIL